MPDLNAPAQPVSRRRVFARRLVSEGAALKESAKWGRADVLAALALLLPGLGLGAAGIITSGATPESRVSVLLLAGIVLLAIGIVLAVVLFRQAMSSEAA